MFEVIFTIAAIFLAVALCTFFYLGSKQLFGDDNEK